MKGFPNQVADLGKLASGMRCIVNLLERGRNPKDDGIFGQALVRAHVAGTGHVPKPVNEYIREQLTKPPDRQSFRTTARGLRQLFRLLGFIDDSGDVVRTTESGRQAAAFADREMDAEQIAFWRQAISNMTHTGTDGLESHPYQVLLRLVARKPGIPRAKCALALEARDDSAEELDRIVALVDLPENQIWEEIRVTKTNWDNAKKILPKFAEQLNDVIKGDDQSFMLSDAPGRADAGPAETVDGAAPDMTRRPRAPRTSRQVTPATIGTAGTAETFDEIQVPQAVDPDVAAAAVRSRLARLRRHNLLVRKLAARLTAAGGRLYEDPFDVLSLTEQFGVLAEIKTLDGTEDDERNRVREALSQLLYYEAFVTRPVAGEVEIRKVVCFERRITDAHIAWLNRQGIAVIWENADEFAGDRLAADFLGRFLEELR